MKGVGINKDGTQRVKGSDIINFVPRINVSTGKKITYTRFCCDIQLQKDDINWIRLIVGGDRLKFDRKSSTKTVVQIHLNSTISIKNTKYAAADMGNFYINSKLELSNYMRIHLSLIPQEIIDEYDVMKYIEADGCVYAEITGIMYGLSQSGHIANQDLQKHLAKYRHYPTKRTPRLWKLQT